MASITPRKNKNGSVSWRLMIRRKGIKPYITSFTSREEAVKFAKETEADYCLNPDDFTIDHLRRKRENEFAIKKGI